ncbi:MAG: urate hydroxylase PuuD [Myxococcota bacterium]|nr:urate hydroxylase PuuD [Myxococcota bacterium]
MESVVTWGEILFRWVHVVAGVTWIGLLYFFNWINGNVGKQLDGPTKQKVLPELLPRTLYFFRWGAAYTWITGVLLLGLIYYMSEGGAYQFMGPVPGEGEGAANHGANVGIAFGAIVLGGTVVYDQLWKAMQSKKEIALGISFVLLVGVMAVMDMVLEIGSRGLFIHVGALFGTCMAMNVWMRIWPAQRKIITAIKAGDAPEPGWGALAGLRSKHNTYMSVPLIYIMVSQHHPEAQKADSWMFLAGLIVVAWLVVFWIYKKAAKPEVAAY